MWGHANSHKLDWSQNISEQWVRAWIEFSRNIIFFDHKKAYLLHVQLFIYLNLIRRDHKIKWWLRIPPPFTENLPCTQHELINKYIWSQYLKISIITCWGSFERSSRSNLLQLNLLFSCQDFAAVWFIKKTASNDKNRYRKIQKVCR